MKPVKALWKVFSIICCLCAFLAGCAKEPSLKGHNVIPLKNRDAAFVQWVIDHEADFKKRCRWQEHLVLGQQAISIAQALKNHNAVTQLSIQLASTQFYQGNFEQCRQLAEQAQTIARASGNRKGEIQSLYLLSAAERATKKPQAVATARHALTLCQQYLPENGMLRAKVLYNLAAAEMEAEPLKLDTALPRFKEADQLYEALGNSHDSLRVKRRMADIYLLKGQYGDAETLLSVIKVSLKSPREQMINAFQLAKAHYHLGQWRQAKTSIDSAYKLAIKLQAKADIDRIKALKQLINNHQLPLNARF
ncbi:hypothetical protein [Candidatus Sororendozoicomonas aggregata]|uniref:hypothetical protein n=1 Tax=Candidatus Sororendozoicomonas aggregata TaxID=3073239 RepID=UPI002ED28291